MDKNALIEYADIKKETEDLRRRIAKLEDEIRKLQESEVSDTVTRGKKGKKPLGVVTVTGIPDAAISRKKILLDARRASLSEKEMELLESMNRVEEFIKTIEKSELRMMFRFYYIDGMTWRQVATAMNRTFPKRHKSYTEDSCRKRHDRFMGNDDGAGKKV